MKQNTHQTKSHSQRLTGKTLAEWYKETNTHGFAFLEYIEKTRERIKSENGGRIGTEIVWWEKPSESAKFYVVFLDHMGNQRDYLLRDNASYAEQIWMIKHMTAKRWITSKYIADLCKIFDEIRAKNR